MPTGKQSMFRRTVNHTPAIPVMNPSTSINEDC